MTEWRTLNLPLLWPGAADQLLRILWTSSWAKEMVSCIFAQVPISWDEWLSGLSFFVLQHKMRLKYRCNHVEVGLFCSRSTSTTCQRKTITCIDWRSRQTIFCQPFHLLWQILESFPNYVHPNIRTDICQSTRENTQLSWNIPSNVCCTVCRFKKCELDDKNILVFGHCCVCIFLFSVPKVLSVVYITRSVHKAENESVVTKSIEFSNAFHQKKTLWKISLPVLSFSPKDIKTEKVVRGKYLVFPADFSSSGCFVAILTRDVSCQNVFVFFAVSIKLKLVWVAFQEQMAQI